MIVSGDFRNHNVVPACVHCGRVVERLGARGPLKRFCSASCAGKASRRIARGFPPDLREAPGRSGGVPVGFWNSRVVVRACEWCGDQYEAKGPGAIGRKRFCSPYCWRRGANRLTGQTTLGEAECAVCGKTFLSHGSGATRKKYCSRGCLLRRPGSYNRQLRARTKLNFKARQRIIARFVERGCYICGEALDRTIRWPDPRSVTLDHVTPVALDGADHVDNLRPVHWRCNREKGDNLPTWWQQQRLAA